MLSLNIIGAGKVGQSLGRLFAAQKQFSIHQICNRSVESSSAALAFIGAGSIACRLQDLSPAKVTLLAVPDDEISSLAETLLSLRLLRSGDIVFHCSGAKSSATLSCLCHAGVLLASVHPVKSFASPKEDVQNFSGTVCSAEGDAAALAVLAPAFQGIGAELLEIDADAKLLYHAGSVFASNYLVTLMEQAINTYCAAGISREMAVRMAKPLATKTLENVFKLGTTAALTGPIQRGDMEMVAQQQTEVSASNAVAGELYAAFVAPTVALANK